MERKLENGMEIAMLFLVLCIVCVVAVKYGGKQTNYVDYVVCNDGKSVPVYHVRTTAMRCGNVVEIEYDGNLYSCLVTSDSDIQTGDTVWAELAIYEGNLEFINVEEGD